MRSPLSVRSALPGGIVDFMSMTKIVIKITSHVILLGLNDKITDGITKDLDRNPSGS